jgi:hypothetical protein
VVTYHGLGHRHLNRRGFLMRPQLNSGTLGRHRTVVMGVLGNIYCIPLTPGAVPWSTILATLQQRALVRPPYRSGSPFRASTNRTDVVWPENWIVPETLHHTAAAPPLRDFPDLGDALNYVLTADDATVTVDSPCAAFQSYPDKRDLSAAVALYRFHDPVHFRIGVPEDMSDLADEFPELANQPTEPKWQGPVTELFWLHGKCVPDNDEFLNSPLCLAMKSIWPDHLVLADVFL